MKIADIKTPKSVKTTSISASVNPERDFLFANECLKFKLFSLVPMYYNLDQFYPWSWRGFQVNVEGEAIDIGIG